MSSLVATVGVGLVAPGRAEASTRAAPTTAAAPVTQPGPADSLLPGPLTAPGGQFLRDSAGRVVFLHGVNAVYKLDPFELYDAPGKPWDFSASDARAMAALGFDVVRLGIVWEGLEPGSLGPNDPTVCNPGQPGDPGQFDSSVADQYLARVEQTVDTLGQYGIYTILDMHQDLYSSVFGGEGAPPWAVCTNGLPATRAPGRWSRTYGTGALDAAFQHFWTNNVVGDLQGEYDRVWTTVATYFSANRWIAGYDPFNEPFSTSLLRVNGYELTNQLDCFYTGRQDPPTAPGTHSSVRCPADDPLSGLIPSIEQADPSHLIFVEPDIFGSPAGPSILGSMHLPNLVLNFHDYCPDRSPTTGNPTNLSGCESHEATTLSSREQQRDLLSTTQKDGPPLFMGEFGATNDPSLLAQITATADHDMVGWTYWQWKYYDDPTGSSAEGLVGPQGSQNRGARVLEQPYPEAVAGTPQDITLDNDADSLVLVYTPDHRITAPTVVFVPTGPASPGGYCASASGGRVVSPTGSSHLRIQNSPGSTEVTVRVTAGPCSSH